MVRLKVISTLQSKQGLLFDDSEFIEPWYYCFGGGVRDFDVENMPESEARQYLPKEKAKSKKRKLWELEQAKYESDENETSIESPYISDDSDGGRDD